MSQDGRIVFYQAREAPIFREEWPRMRSHAIVPRPKEGWIEPLISEWSLEGAAWEDYHPHAEYNYVLEGELHISVEGEEVVLRVGDSATVPAGKLGRYWAPKFARMLTVYGPNPDGDESSDFKYEEL
jgi:mannose-6-phosphate isomerase-like protein (cupin superfamily)